MDMKMCIRDRFIIVAIVAALAAVATFFVIKSAKNEAKGSSQMTETATEDSLSLIHI